MGGYAPPEACTVMQKQGSLRRYVALKERVCFQDNVARICLLTRLLDASMSELGQLQGTERAREELGVEHSLQRS